MATSSGSSSTKDQREIVNGFQELRQQQRHVVNKINQLEQDLHEHGLVIKTLSEVEPSRRCFRMIGGVLVERNVGQVLPALQHNKTQISSMLESLNKQIEVKGREIQAYTEKHNIRFKSDIDKETSSNETSQTDTGQSVLVSPS